MRRKVVFAVGAATVLFSLATLYALGRALIYGQIGEIVGRGLQ